MEGQDYTTIAVEEIGASAEAIALHYDTGREFFRLWLDPDMVYSCAMWSDETQSLEEAQQAKIDFHIREAHAERARRVLDIGCGWGAALRRLVEVHHVEEAVGLTLSPDQVDWISGRRHPQIEVLAESWASHVPEDTYDAIISIGALEHFVRPGLCADAKQRVYRSFFERCHRWLRPGGRMSLQTIGWGNAGHLDIAPFIAEHVFPDSDLPRLAEIVTAAERLFEVTAIRNDRLQYARTVMEWMNRLRSRRRQALEVAGEETVALFERYLRLAGRIFRMGSIVLYRITLQRIDHPRPDSDG